MPQQPRDRLTAVGGTGVGLPQHVRTPWRPRRTASTSITMEGENLLAVRMDGRRRGVMAGEEAWGGVIPPLLELLRISSSTGGLTRARKRYSFV